MGISDSSGVGKTTGLNEFELRFYDAKIGIWLSTARLSSTILRTWQWGMKGFSTITEFVTKITMISMKVAIQILMLCSMCLQTGSSSISFFKSGLIIKCQCFLLRDGKTAGKSYVFSYSARPIKMNELEHFPAKSSYFPTGELLLRLDGSKIFGVRPDRSSQMLLMDFNLKDGDTLKVAPTLEYTLERSFFDRSIDEDIFSFRRSKNSRELSDGCENIAFAVSRRRGFVKLTYRCADGNDFACSIKELR